MTVGVVPFKAALGFQRLRDKSREWLLVFSCKSWADNKDFFRFLDFQPRHIKDSQACFFFGEVQRRSRALPKLGNESGGPSSAFGLN